jgi:threonyl-tRNA synthetase
VVAPISEQTEAYALEVAEQLTSAGLTVETDLRNEKIGYKIREHSLAKVPLLIVIGQREMQDGQVTLRWLHGGHQKTLPLAQALSELTGQNQYPSYLTDKQTGHPEYP